MNDVLISQVCTLLATMKGFPNWPVARAGDPPTAMDRAYFAGLQDLSDDVGRLICNKALFAFDERPSVKQLREWAVSMAPARTFQIEGPAAGNPLRLVTTLGDQPASAEAFAAHVLPPMAAKEVIVRLKATAAPPESRFEYGLRFETLPGFKGAGHVSRTHPHYTLEGARRAAQERNEKWPHVETTVFHKDDPMPRRWGRTDTADEAEAHEDALAETERVASGRSGAVFETSC